MANDPKFKRKTSSDFNFFNELSRKSVHLFVLIIPLAYHVLNFELWIIQLGLLATLLVFIPLEFYRLRINPDFWLNYLTRQAEKTEPANYVLVSIVWFLILLGVNFFYSIEMAEMAIVATHLGDSLAALVGRGLGKNRLPLTEGKTIEGYIAGVIGTYTVGWIFLLWLGIPSLLLPVVPALAVGLFDFFENLPFWAADNLIHPWVTVLVIFAFDMIGILPYL
ncbi:MAG: diacylglycerol/polyprenol kinase family protein [Candidatus Thorarchaeota archaeon]